MIRTGGSAMKRAAISTIAVVGLLFGVAGNVAASTTTVTTEVSYTLTQAACPRLAPGTIVTGTGTQISTTTTHVRPNGITTVTDVTRSEGSATDQSQNAYTWEYRNSFVASTSLAQPAVLSGVMVDSFKLSGGPAALGAGFVGLFTSNFAFTTFSATPLLSYGDPIAFAPEPFAYHCDPL